MDLSKLAMRGVSPRAGGVAARACFVVTLALSACTSSSVVALAPAEASYLDDAASRRAALVASLVNPANAYSTLRLQHYATGDAADWEALPEWNPRALPVAAAELDGPPFTTGAPLPAAAAALGFDASAAATLSSATLHALGEEAFFRYPAQLAPAPALAFTRDAVARYGLWIDPARGVGGFVRVEVAGGGSMLAVSCATCHADVIDGRLVVGVPSAHLDFGRMALDASGAADPVAANLAAWGSGRVDVTTSEGSLPERISDLRSLRWVSHLQYDATVRQADVVALAIRIETLIITAHAQAVRPPRLVALALARYLWDLGLELPPPPSSTSDGARVFAARCAGCHAGEGFTGPPRALADVGTDAALGLSPDRGTGFYRVPSLRGVAARPTLFHDGALVDLAALLDPARVSPSYAGGARGPGPVPGHAFGLELSDADRAALLTYLRAL